MKQTLVSVILPSYNERQNLLILIPKIFSVFAQMPWFTVEIIVVDDYSPDGTASALQKKFSDRIRLIVRNNERGLGTAIGAGVRASHGKIIIGMDADGNHNPIYIPALLSNLADNDIVIGSRFLNHSRMVFDTRFFSSYIFNMCIRIGLGFPVHDNTSGFYAVYKKTLLHLRITQIYQGYGDYHLRLVWLAKKYALRIKEIPVVYGKRLHGQSKSQHAHMLITYGKTILQLLFHN